MAVDTHSLKNALLKEESVEKRNRLTAQFIREQLKVEEVDVSDIEATIVAYLLKMKMLYFYTCKRKFSGNVLLIRAEEQTLMINSKCDLSNDFGLSEVTH